MGNYNIDNLEKSQFDTTNGNGPEKKPQFLMAFLAGFGTSVIVGVILALFGIWLEAEYMLILIIGAIIVGCVITNFVPHKSIGGALIGMILFGEDINLQVILGIVLVLAALVILGKGNRTGPEKLNG